MLFKACLNGNRTRQEHPGVPQTPAELAEAARDAWQAGSGAVHVHPRGADGKPSLNATDMAATLNAIRTLCPGLPVGVSTTDGIEPNVKARWQAITNWNVQPDFASVNFSEPDAERLTQHFLAVGVGVEAGLSGQADVERLLQSGLVPRCLRLLLEPEEQRAQDAQANALNMIGLLDGAALQVPRLLHGFDDAAWPLLEFAGSLAYDTRIGLEDVLMLPDGRRAHDNASLVHAARGVIHRVG